MKSTPTLATAKTPLGMQRAQARWHKLLMQRAQLAQMDLRNSIECLRTANVADAAAGLRHRRAPEAARQRPPYQAALKCGVLLMLVLFGLGAQELPPLTVVVPKGRAVRIVEVNVATSLHPVPRPDAGLESPANPQAGKPALLEVQRPLESSPIPRSAILRELARQPRPPGTQRFKAIKVEEHALNRPEDDGELRTNYVVTWLALPDGTNAVMTWGAVKARTLRTESRWPTQKDDEWEFSPVPNSNPTP